jgi:hypothetical protein
MVRALIQNGSPSPDVLTAMMAAAVSEGWLVMLQSAALNRYAEAVADAWEQMPARLNRADPYEVVNDVVAAARDRALREGSGGVAVGLAERAMARLLLERTAAAPMAGDAPTDLASRWRETRGVNPGDLASTFLAETMRQVARHFFARDAAVFIGTAAIPDVRALRALTRSVGDAAAGTAEQARPILTQRGTAAWAEGVRVAVVAGGTRKSLSDDR